MKISEIINEGKGGSMHPNHADASTGVMKARDVGGYDRIYHMNRLWMAMAQADGKSKDAVDMDAASFAEKYNTVHPYTEEEHNMFVAATKTVPTDSKKVVPYSKSKEANDTHTLSPVLKKQRPKFK